MKITFQWFSQMLGGLAVLASLLFVGYELKRNNDLAVVQSQQELVSISLDLKALLADRELLDVLMSDSPNELGPAERLLFVAHVGAWFDLYELVILSRQKDIVTEEQFIIWMNGLCTLPSSWLVSFAAIINDKNSYLKDVGENVDRCLRGELLGDNSSMPIMALTSKS